MSEYRIVDDNSLPTTIPNVAIHEEPAVSPPFQQQQRLNFTGMINPPGYNHPAESTMGVFGGDNAAYSMANSSQPFPPSKLSLFHHFWIGKSIYQFIKQWGNFCPKFVM